jgi:hypothetical protein
MDSINAETTTNIPNGNTWIRFTGIASVPLRREPHFASSKQSSANLFDRSRCDADMIDHSVLEMALAGYRVEVQKIEEAMAAVHKRLWIGGDIAISVLIATPSRCRGNE